MTPLQRFAGQPAPPAASSAAPPILPSCQWTALLLRLHLKHMVLNLSFEAHNYFSTFVGHLWSPLSPFSHGHS